MGSYTTFEYDIAQLSIDELSELYLNGDLDKMYDEYENNNEIRIGKGKLRKGVRSQ